MARPKQRAGQAIKASTINAGVEARNLLDALTVAPPLELSAGSNGLTIRLAAFITEIRVGVANGAITAATNLATPGTGSAYLAKYTNPGYSTSGVPSVAVINMFTKTGGIATGKVVYIARINGVWQVIAADC